MTADISNLPLPDRLALADWIGERPDTVLVVAALQCGHGRVWLWGKPAAPTAALLESGLTPGEPQGFGDGEALLGLLRVAHQWSGVEVNEVLSDAIAADFDDHWGPTAHVVDVVHVLEQPVQVRPHSMVRQLGHGSSMATGSRFADVGVHVAEGYRQMGIATAAASMACHGLQADGPVPVWGTGSYNAASLRVAEKLGFVEVARLRFLVRGDM